MIDNDKEGKKMELRVDFINIYIGIEQESKGCYTINHQASREIASRASRFEIF